MTRYVSWFSCGAASAVATKLLLASTVIDDVAVVRIVIKDEHGDNERFHLDCERWLRKDIARVSSTKYKDCQHVWEQRRYMSGITGAPCTAELKKAVRWDFEREWGPDVQVFGFTLEEIKRAETFRQNNPEVRLLTPLIDAGLSKRDCHAIIADAGIRSAEMYRLGFSNNNCIGCVKASSITYWARVRHCFPEVFAARAKLSRDIGCRLTRLKGERIFLDEIPATIDWRRSDKENIDCGLLCVGDQE